MSDFIRALRLPFASASALGFIFGSLVGAGRKVQPINFVLGLAAAVTVHLAANLINDFADSRSGVDWQDRKAYNFFGGSKLIQEGKLSETFYFKSAIILFAVSVACVFFLALHLNRFSTLAYYFLIIFLGWSYSQGPLALSYHRLGEVAIFLLFGPALVMGGYFTQTGVFPDLKSFLLSIPLGIFTVAILFANEIPDYSDDCKCNKLNWVSFLGPAKSYILYLVLITLGFASVILNVAVGNLSRLSLISLIGLIPALQAAQILKRCFSDKLQLMRSSKLTIAVHTLVGVILIIAALW